MARFDAAGKRVFCLHCGAEELEERGVWVPYGFSTFFRERRQVLFECHACGASRSFRLKQRPVRVD